VREAAQGGGVLDTFIAANRAVLIANAAARVATRTFPNASDVELTHGIPLFLDQLGEALVLARASDVVEHSQIEASARKHGLELLRMGLTIGQVVHDYGDVCQTITELAVRENVNIGADEFRTLNLCLDDAIAGAVTAFAQQRELTVASEGTERLGVFAHELRNALHTGTLAFASIQTGRVAPGGSTALVLGRSLAALGALVDRTLADVRMEAGMTQLERLSVAELMEELEISSLLHAQAKGLQFVATSHCGEALILGDRHILVAAISNLLHNAFKFTRSNSRVSLSASATADHVSFAVEDECGGLPEGFSEAAVQPFVRGVTRASGLGLGLVICTKAARAHGGALHIRDLPGHGCVMTLELPRIAMS
jgi:hypothetical protein